MHAVVYYVAVTWVIGLLATLVIHVARTRTLPTVLLTINSVTVMLVALVLVDSAHSRSGHHLDTALVLALLSFAEILAVARFLEHRRLFP